MEALINVQARKKMAVITQRPPSNRPTRNKRILIPLQEATRQDHKNFLGCCSVCCRCVVAQMIFHFAASISIYWFLLVVGVVPHCCHRCQKSKKKHPSGAERAWFGSVHILYASHQKGLSCDQNPAVKLIGQKINREWAVRWNTLNTM